jgi:hypothetical protein
MARDVDVSWGLPTTRKSGRPLDPADVAAVELSLSSDNVNWSAYDSFPKEVLATVIPELDIGEWFVQGVVLDTNGKRSAPSVKSIVVPDDSEPSALELTLTF